MDASRGNAISIATSAAFSTAAGVGQEGWHPDFSAARYTRLRVIGIKTSFKDSWLRSSEKSCICWHSDSLISRPTVLLSIFQAFMRQVNPQIPAFTEAQISIDRPLAAFCVRNEPLSSLWRVISPNKCLKCTKVPKMPKIMVSLRSVFCISRWHRQYGRPEIRPMKWQLSVSFYFHKIDRIH